MHTNRFLLMVLTSFLVFAGGTEYNQTNELLQAEAGISSVYSKVS